MIFKKAKTKRKKFYNKEKTAKSRTWTIRTEGRLLDHCATLPSMAYYVLFRPNVFRCLLVVLLFFFFFIA